MLFRSESPESGLMIAKRIRKLDTMKNDLPQPDIHGDEVADVSFVGWGSTKNTILDAMDQLKLSNPDLKVNYLHYTYLFPLKTDLLLDFVSKNSNVIYIEGSATGQLADLITKETRLDTSNRMLKWNGRPFYLEEILDKVNVVIA